MLRLDTYFTEGLLYRPTNIVGYKQFLSGLEKIIKYLKNYMICQVFGLHG